MSWSLKSLKIDSGMSVCLSVPSCYCNLALAEVIITMITRRNRRYFSISWFRALRPG